MALFFCLTCGNPVLRFLLRPLFLSPGGSALAFFLTLCLTHRELYSDLENFFRQRDFFLSDHAPTRI